MTFRLKQLIITHSELKLCAGSATSTVDMLQNIEIRYRDVNSRLMIEPHTGYRGGALIKVYVRVFLLICVSAMLILLYIMINTNVYITSCQL